MNIRTYANTVGLSHEKNKNLGESRDACFSSRKSKCLTVQPTSQEQSIL